MEPDPDCMSQDSYTVRKQIALNRLAVKYTRLAQAVFDSSIKFLRSDIERALNDKMKSFQPDREHSAAIQKKLEKIYNDHFAETVKVSVSDSLREVAPATGLGLASARKWPVDFPMELTFTNLAEKKVRDSLYDRIFRKTGRGLKIYFKSQAKRQTEHYLKTVSNAFRGLTKSYFEDEDSEDTAKEIKRALAKLLGDNATRAEAVFRTETTKHFNKSRLAYFSDNTDVDFVQIKSKADNRVSKICEARHDYVVPIAKASLAYVNRRKLN
ncbi:MAG: hypothetical protein EOP06_18370, partial [Proteobacteria bacterium]